MALRTSPPDNPLIAENPPIDTLSNWRQHNAINLAFALRQQHQGFGRSDRHGNANPRAQAPDARPGKKH